jgi:hypothetical protein
MKKYKVVKIVQDYLTYEEACDILANMEDVGEKYIDIIEYDFVKPEYKRMGRDPDIH